MNVPKFKKKDTSKLNTMNILSFQFPVNYNKKNQLQENSVSLIIQGQR